MLLQNHGPITRPIIGRAIPAHVPDRVRTVSSLSQPSARSEASSPAEPAPPSSGPVVRSDHFGSTDSGESEARDLDPGFQLPHPEIAHQARFSLFQGMPPELITDAHRALDAWGHAGDRMLVAQKMPVPPAARSVAAVYLYHGWVSYPGRDRLAEFTGMKPRNITRALDELEGVGFIDRRTRTIPGRGQSSSIVAFNGLAVCQIIVTQTFSPLFPLAEEILRFHRALSPAVWGEFALPPVSSGPCDHRSVNTTPRPPGETESAETRSVRLTPRPGVDTAAGVPRSVNTTLRVSEESVTEESIAEPRSVRLTPPGVSIRHPNHDDDLIDNNNINLINQSSNQGPGSRSVNLTPRGTASRECPACGSAELNAEACAACGVLFDSLDDSSSWPAWYRDLAARVPPENLPGWDELLETQLLADWSEDVLREAADRYISQYAGQRVSAPLKLFGKVAASVASERVRSGRGGGGSAGGARRSGRPRDPGLSVSEQPAPVQAQAVCTCEALAAAAAEALDPQAQQLWAKTLEALSLELPVTTFETWLKDSEGVRRDGENLAVRVASVFTIAWIEQRMYQSILRALRGCCGPTWDVHFEVSERAACRIHGTPGSN